MFQACIGNLMLKVETGKIVIVEFHDQSDVAKAKIELSQESFGHLLTMMASLNPILLAMKQTPHMNVLIPKHYAADTPAYEDMEINYYDDWGVRALNIFSRYGICTYGDLCKHTSRELHAMKHLGPTTYQEIINHLEKRGLRLKKEGS